MLPAADGVANARITELTGSSVVTVLKWWSRYEESGIVGLTDDQRPDQPKQRDHFDIVTTTLMPPPKNTESHTGPLVCWASISRSATRPWLGHGANTESNRGKRKRTSSPATPNWRKKSLTSSACTWHRRRTRWCCMLTRNHRSRLWIA